MKEWLYGRHPVRETLRARRRKIFQLRMAQGVQVSGNIQEIIQLCEGLRVPVELRPRQELDRVHPQHQGVLLEVEEFPYQEVEDIFEQAALTQEHPFILLLDTLQDPQNLGALLRTAESVGVHGVILPRHSAVGVTPAVVNASSGATEHLAIVQANLHQAILDLKARDVWVVGLDQGPQAQPLGTLKLNGPLALVVGSEGQGLRRLVAESCDVLLSLPMRGRVESLNAAVAGSVALYFAYQERTKKS